MAKASVAAVCGAVAESAEAFNAGIGAAVSVPGMIGAGPGFAAASSAGVIASAIGVPAVPLVAASAAEAANISGDFGLATGAEARSAFTLSSIAVHPPSPARIEAAMQRAMPRSVLTFMPISITRCARSHRQISRRFVSNS